jgi:hypothetical protein
MKKWIFPVLLMVLTVFIWLSCSKSAENKIAGTWKVEDVKFDSPVPMDEGQLEASRQSAKQVSYELLKDNTAIVHAGKTVLEGHWVYKEAEAGVYMAFKGTKDTVLLGRLTEGKLINEASRPNMKITTVFTKEEK